MQASSEYVVSTALASRRVKRLALTYSLTGEPRRRGGGREARRPEAGRPCYLVITPCCRPEAGGHSTPNLSPTPTPTPSLSTRSRRPSSRRATYYLLTSYYSLLTTCYSLLRRPSSSRATCVRGSRASWGPSGSAGTLCCTTTNPSPTPTPTPNLDPNPNPEP